MSFWPVLYFGLLVPSIFVLPSFDRGAIAFALAGPLALAVAVMFFSSVRIDLGSLKSILTSLLAPAVALAVYVLRGIASIQSLSFSDNSSFQTSGDYGPNQVSLILALGGLAAIYLVFVEKKMIYRVTISRLEPVAVGSIGAHFFPLRHLDHRRGRACGRYIISSAIPAAGSGSSLPASYSACWRILLFFLFWIDSPGMQSSPATPILEAPAGLKWFRLT